MQIPISEKQARLLLSLQDQIRAAIAQFEMAYAAVDPDVPEGADLREVQLDPPALIYTDPPEEPDVESDS